MAIMEIIKESEINKHFFKDVVFVYPTETAYGLGVCALNEDLLDRIYKIKKRPKSKVFPLIAASLYQVQKYFYLSQEERNLADKYWPGPLTILLKPKRDFPKSLLGIDGRIGVRVSSNELARNLAKKCAEPIVATSANISGNANIYKIEKLIEEFKNFKYKPDLIVDGGDLAGDLSSTVVYVDDGTYNVLRQGDIELGD